MSKFNSRRRTTGIGNLPSYKVWVYEISTITQTGAQMVYFFWCEKGKEAADFYDPASITMNDLSFLKNFMNAEELASVGW